MVDFLEPLKGTSVGEVLNALFKEGIPGAGGAIAGGFIGAQVENMYLGKDINGNQIVVTPTDTLGTKFLAWAANNAPKGLAWYLLRNRPEWEKIRSGALISAGLDTVFRFLNNGVPANLVVNLNGKAYRILGAGAEGVIASPMDVQGLVQRNQMLEAELAKAIQGGQLSAAYRPRSYPYLAQDQIQPMQPISPIVARRQRAFSFMQPAPVPGAPGYPYGPPPVEGMESPTQRQYAFMQSPPGVIARQKGYGFMGEKGPTSMLEMFGFKES
jgi:hypothetical protein